MEQQSRHYPDWKAPSEDASVLVWPDAPQMLREVASNQSLLGSSESILIQGIPLPQVRKRMREFVGHDHAAPLIATGHQVELHHPGVWVKNILINQLAEKSSGQALHFAIDTDSPKHLALRWPGGSIPLTDDPNLNRAAWSALVEAPTPSHLAQIEQRLQNTSAQWDFKPELTELLLTLRRLALESTNLPSALANAMHELDWQLGMRHHILLASPIWMSEAHLLLAHDLIARADVIAIQYNTALQSYRDEQGIHSHMRPMPDLLISEEAVEIPFWLDDLQSGKRSRPSVFRRDGGWMLQLIGGEEFVFDPQVDGWTAAQRFGRWLNQTQHRITPRALTNMLFLRLFLSDYFIHGIGGGRYDQVTDRLIELHFCMEPPKFGVTTATMYFPDAIGKERVCIPCVKQEGHHLKHNLLGSRKRQLVAQIASLPRRSADRAARFSEMRRELSSLAIHSDVLQRWQDRFRETQEREKQEQTLFDRELFYAIQPRERLNEMIGKYRAEFTVS